jgi:Methyltransferase domain
VHRSGRAIEFRNGVGRAVRKLPPPRDEAATALLRATVDLLTGRPRATPRAVEESPTTQPSNADHPYNPNAIVRYRPGSPESPIVNVTEVTGRGSDLGELVSMAGIDLDLDAHARVWADWAPGVSRWNSSASDGRRYRADNSMFGQLSAAMLAGAVNAVKPRRYVEIGSGFSSAVLPDINDEWRREDPIELTFIDPAPKRLLSVLRDGDRDACTIFTERVQEINLSVFDALEPGDILFIDSSHVAKTDSDVLRELFVILPRLPAGTLIHFHDILYPFDYPMKWLVEQNRSWNEAYFLRAFLMYNYHFRVHFWTDFFAQFGATPADPEMFRPLAGQRQSSIWITPTAR